MICSICLQDRETLKFRTGRLSICGRCVHSLNTTTLSPRIAEQRWRESFRAGIIRRDPDAITWIDRWLRESGEWILSERMDDADRVRRSPELKVLRAYRSGLVCIDRRYLDYPDNWEFKRYRLKHWDDYSCRLCGARESDDVVLHAHHIVHRSKSGTNSYRNLVTLCFRHHQAQHDHAIGLDRGEPPGPDHDDEPDEADMPLAAQSAPVLPAIFDSSAYASARPVFESALEAFRASGKTRQELFVFLIQTFGRNVGRYALRFSDEERLGFQLKDI